MKKIRGFEIVKKEFRKSEGEIILPIRGSINAMAYDFYTPYDVVIKPNEKFMIWTDVKAYMQPNEALILNVRSSASKVPFMLANTQGWVDSDYYENSSNDGNIGIYILNLSDKDIEFKTGDRIAQGMFTTYLVTDNDSTIGERKGGFGSTNR